MVLEKPNSVSSCYGQGWVISLAKLHFIVGQPHSVRENQFWLEQQKDNIGS